MSKSSTESILSDAAATLATVRLGLSDVLNTNPERRLPGVRNVVVFGRAVTNILQRLRSTEPEFNAWYQPFVAEMQADPLLSYLYKLRSEILKEGKLSTSVITSVSSFNFPSDMQRMGPPPPNAKSFFIGDQTGGSGWEVEVPDGSIAKYYVNLPGDIATSTVHLPDAPTEHLGQPLNDASIGEISQHYFNYLDNLLKQAKEHFSNP